MMRLLFLCPILLSFLSLRANEDSLIVYSLLEQANQTQTDDSTMFYAEQAMSYAKKHNYTDGILTVAKHFGNLYAQTGELQKSIDTYQQLLNEKQFNAKQLSTAYNQMGIYHVYMGHYDSTEAYFLKALELRKQMKDSVGIGASLNNLGNVVMTTGDYDKATAYFIEALKIREQIKDSAGIATSTNNLGLIYYKQQKFDEAINYYHQALLLNQKQKLPSKEILILLNLGNIYDEISVFDSAEYYYDIAIKKAEEFGEARLKAMAYGNMGVTQDKKGNYELAKNYYQKALQIRIESDDLEGQAIIYNNLGGVYMSTKNYQQAAIYFKKSLGFSEQINYLEATRDNYLGLSDAYEKMKDYKNSVDAYQKYILIKDSMLNETTTQQIEELNTQYQTEKKEKEIAEQQIQIVKQQLEYKQRNYLTLGIGLAVLFLLISGGFIYHYQKQKQLRLLQENKLKDELALVKIQNELHSERLKISSGLNDNIGSQLTYVISSVDNIRHQFTQLDNKLEQKLSSISNFTKTTITQLRDTIWALNKDEISFEDLISRLYNYIETANLAQEQTQFVFNPQLKSSLYLNSLQGVNIYRVIQEAINNSIKYAAATQVKLLINEQQEDVMIKIVDDGIGFKMENIVLGNGLENMRNRASAINAQFSIDSFPDKGTTITLAINKTEFKPNKANGV